MKTKIIIVIINKLNIMIKFNKILYKMNKILKIIRINMIFKY